MDLSRNAKEIALRALTSIEASSCCIPQILHKTRPKSAYVTAYNISSVFPQVINFMPQISTIGVGAHSF